MKPGPHAASAAESPADAGDDIPNVTARTTRDQRAYDIVHPPLAWWRPDTSRARPCQTTAPTVCFLPTYLLDARRNGHWETISAGHPHVPRASERAAGGRPLCSLHRLLSKR
jgi:hypothetical protein